MYKRKEQPNPCAKQVPSSISQLGLKLTQPTNVSHPFDCFNPIHSDLDLPIAVRKVVRSCTQHHIAQFISYHRLSPNHKSFLTFLDSIAIPKTIEKALQNQNWVQAMHEEMRALEKNQTQEIVPRPMGVQPVGANGCLM